MEYPPRRTSTSKIAGVALLVVLAAALGAVGTYYLVPAKPAASATNTITSTTTSFLTSTVGGTGTSLSGGGTAQISIDAGQIYRSANESIVTVAGYITASVNLFFGTQAVQEEVLGSGFTMNYDNSNYIVTNYHVVDGAANMTVTFWNGNAYPATTVGTDPYSDLAVLKVPEAPSSEFRPLSLSPSSAVQVGDPVAAIGNPYGLTGSLTVGVVSQLGRTITEAAAGNYSIADIIQFSAPINPGNSGGPLFNAAGQVIGLTTATINGSVGVGFAIPSDTVTRELPSLISSGSYNQHPYIGVGTADMFYQLAQANGNNVTYGVLVENLVAGGPAASAGLHGGTKQAVVQGSAYLLGGDVIVSVNGTRILNHDALASYLEEHAQVGHTLAVGIVRGTTAMTVNVVPGARPPPPASASSG